MAMPPMSVQAAAAARQTWPRFRVRAGVDVPAALRNPHPPPLRLASGAGVPFGMRRAAPPPPIPCTWHR